MCPDLVIEPRKTRHWLKNLETLSLEEQINEGDKMWTEEKRKMQNHRDQKIKGEGH